MVVAARYHTVVAALSSGVPVISLSWHDKYRALMRLFGQEAYVADLEALEIARLKQRVDALWAERDAARAEILSHKLVVSEGVAKGIHLTKEVIEGTASGRDVGVSGAGTVADVFYRDLCCSCGMCALVCPTDAISIQEHLQKGLLGPVIDPDRCTACGACSEVCPGRAVDIVGLNRQVFGESPADVVMGSLDAVYVAWSTDQEIRYQSASGGIVTTLLCDLLERGEIDGALVVGTNQERPLRPKAFLAGTSQQITAACGSKYCPVSFDTGLAGIADQPGRYAVVGLPCHLHGIRALEAQKRIFRERIVFHIGLICGRNSTFHATDYFLRSKGVDPEAVKSIAYRAKGWPGQICVELEDGTERCFARSTSDRSYSGQRLFHSAFHFDFIQPRCLTCFDTFAAFADVSAGDAWLPEIKREERIGKSIIIVRTNSGRRVVDSAADRKRIFLEPLAIEKLRSRNLHFVRSFPVRMRLLGLTGKAVPEYRLPEAARSSDGAILERAMAAATFVAFLPSFFSYVRGLWPVITVLGHVRQMLLVVAEESLKCLRFLRRHTVCLR
jgi:coenzyme F420 hydrogenase subunit beta